MGRWSVLKGGSLGDRCHARCGEKNKSLRDLAVLTERGREAPERGRAAKGWAAVFKRGVLESRGAGRCCARAPALLAAG